MLLQGRLQSKLHQTGNSDAKREQEGRGQLPVLTGIEQAVQKGRCLTDTVHTILMKKKEKLLEKESRSYYSPH